MSREPAAVASQGVGPVLQSSPLARAVLAALEDRNEGVVVHDEGAYLRILVPAVCRLFRGDVEDHAGRAVQFPGELEVIMPSFAGLVAMNEDGAVWWLATEPRPDPPSSGT
jgi:hypothetical protein